NETDVILMDEPFGALDAITRARLQADLLSIQRKQHRTVFFITHDVDEAVFLGDRVLVMSARPGRVVFDQEVTLSAQAGRMLGEEMRKLPDFIELRERIAGAIEHWRYRQARGTTPPSSVESGSLFACVRNQRAPTSSERH